MTADEYSEDNIVLVSAISHYSYCPRRCGLIHVDHLFDENVFTLRGSMAHERADVAAGMQEHGVRVEKALPIWSDRWGLYGKADVVEFAGDGAPHPVEYKFGPKRAEAHDDLQLCAQALCLEEMFGCPVPRGAIYHISSHQRREVEFADELKQATLEVVKSIRGMLLAAVLPPPVNDSRCPNCSLVDVCLPSSVVRINAIETAELFVPVSGEVVE